MRQVGIFGLGDRRRGRRAGGPDPIENLGYVGPCQATVVPFLESLAGMSKADWYRVAAVAQRAPAWEEDLKVREACASSGRETNASIAATLAERYLMEAGGDVWQDSFLAQRVRAEVAAEAEGRTATMGDVLAASGGEEIRAASLALTKAVSALVVSDVVPLASLEPLLAPFRRTAAVLPPG